MNVNAFFCEIYLHSETTKCLLLKGCNSYYHQLINNGFTISSPHASRSCVALN